MRTYLGPLVAEGIFHGVHHHVSQCMKVGIFTEILDLCSCRVLSNTTRRLARKQRSLPQPAASDLVGAEERTDVKNPFATPISGARQNIMRQSITQVISQHVRNKPTDILVLPAINVRTSRDSYRVASLFTQSYYSSPATSTVSTESASTDTDDSADNFYLEERFLKAVSFDDMNDVRKCLDENVDVHVQNGFNR